MMSVEQYKRLMGESIAAFDIMADELAAKMRSRGLTDDIADEILSEIS